MEEDPSVVAAGSSLGALLRETRESMGIPLEEAARVTRIGQNYLAALEADRFERLPNPAYVRGFIRNYASFLGITPDSLVSRYERVIAPPAAEGGTSQRKQSVSNRGKQRIPGRRWLVIVSLLPIALAVYFFVKREGRGPHAPSPHAPAAVTASARIPVPVPVPAVTAPAVAREPAPVSPLATEGVLRMKVSEETHLVMNIDDSVVQEYQLRPGDLIEWKGEKAFTLELSNAGGVEVELGGKRLRPFGARGSQARVVVRMDGSIE